MRSREICNKLWVNYRLTSLITSVTVFLIYLFFTTKVKSFPHDFSSLVASAAMSILMGYQFALIIFSLTNIHSTFEKFSPIFQDNQYRIFSQNLEKKFQKNRLFCFTLISVVGTFAILEFEKWKWYGKSPFFYTYEHTLWSLLLDIINHVFEYSILVLLAAVTWIIIELILIVNELKKKYTLKIDVFDADKTGGLKPLRFLILSIVSNYLIIITLAIISYIPPTATIRFQVTPEVIITPEAILLIIMLLLGIILYITTQETIRNLIDKGINLELEKVNKKRKEIYEKIHEIIDNKTIKDHEKELEELGTVLDFLEREDREINAIKYKRFDINSIITFITASLLPIITLIKEIVGFL